jgi:predicted nucleic acid-binding protein
LTVCLDSWAVIAWLLGHQPALDHVNASIPDRPVMSWLNLVEVAYRIERMQGRAAADETVAELRRQLDVELPGTTRMIEAARLKARYPMALADCFAVATAAATGATLWTGDPEIIGAPDLPCAVLDLR